VKAQGGYTLLVCCHGCWGEGIYQFSAFY